MVADLLPRRGEIWWGSTPGRPDDPHQPRPVLIISEDIRNRRLSHVTIIPIFSSGRSGPTRVFLPAGTGGLPHDSVLVCEEISTIDHDFLQRGPIGPRVTAIVLAEVVRAVRVAIGDVPLPR